ncbi:UpxY family transcription antiterminator [Flavobacterium sp.]|jgi:transcription antitermination factor NusG|uniref:UpxY family transcription antiterminator n=1 Tax=Flavobacterium sp. TaxID=239 RepID=UPI0022CB5C20|nr:UpxY family transcription antiterminator [Flavobacterium sp.]MCZ8230056.1 UpxY family transcription antiterminator [Flavobacterium sp.]
MNWYVLYTKPKWEKKVAERLSEIGITAYCPTVVKVQQWSDRKKKVVVPLFSSYVFVQLAENNRNAVFSVTGVVRYLFWLGKPALVRDQEIHSIRQWLSEPDAFEVELASWQPGDRVVLEQGVFKDHIAVVQEVKASIYVLVLEALGCVLKVAKKKA